jgi:diguanylate cyclase (GGDEF)-like protein
LAKSSARLADKGTQTRGTQTSWDRARLSIVVPISVIVAVAIVCIVVAVLTSARRADEVALEHEKRLFSRALVNHGERILRELESVAATEEALRRIRDQFDRDWVHNRIGLWLKNYFDHDFVFVADGSDRLTYTLLGRNSVDPSWFNSIVPELTPTLDYMRGRSGAEPNRALRISEPRRVNEADGGNRTVLVQRFLGRPAAVAARLIASGEQIADPALRATAPIVIAVKFIDEDVLADIAARVQLEDLHIAEQIAQSSEYVYEMKDKAGHSVMRLAWLPKKPGAEIVKSVIPFIAVAFAGFALLAGLIHGYMRRTAATIAQGEQRLRYLALHDPLCGLPNRNFFGERLEQVIKDVQNGGAPAAVFYIDLDHFKDVNDTLGHPVGDELIRNVTARLSALLRPEDLVGRLGGDEFAVISLGANDIAQVHRLADRIISAICAPYTIGGHNILIGASIGIAIVDENSRGAADVMRYADMALYRAKNEGRNRACIYDAAMDADLSERKRLENDLREAIAKDGLKVAYQPIVNTSGDIIVAVEALARWHHSERGDIEPSQFIPIAEHSGLIIELGEWVLRRACTDGKAWPGVTVSVNVSPLQFRRPDFVDTVERILAETGFDATQLELEITESTLLGNVDNAEVAMHRLKAIGLRLALDDFGTGYSSLAYLRRFPFDKLKIDKSFVHSIERSPDAAAIVHAIVGLGRGLGMKVTAEGVETAEQQLFLRAAGVHSMQGYRFGRPGSPSLISTRLAMPGPHRSSIVKDAAALAG